MAWLFGSAAPAAATAAVPAGAATIAAPAAGAAGAAGAGAGAAAAPAAAGILGGLGQMGQGFGQGALGIGAAPASWQGQLGSFLGQQAHQPMPSLPPMGASQQMGQQPLGSMFQRPSQSMDPQLLQQIGMMLMGLRR